MISFRKSAETGVILVEVSVNEAHDFVLALDTGCSHTTIDFTALKLADVALGKSVDSVLIETANGIVRTDVFVVEQLSALGLSKQNARIQVYDFLAHGLAGDYDGMLGLDFLDGTNFCINTRDETITIA